jgi:RNA polymerase sigma factor (sigma-70 family)
LARDPNGAVLRQVRLLFEAGPLTFWGDGALLDAFASRQDSAGEAAFTALVERHGPMVLRVCRAVLRDEHAAHDAFQATFLVLARRARSVRVGETLGPWLHGVAWRVAMRARAASARRRRHERRAAEMASRTVEPAVNADDAEALLHEEIRRLPERFRTAVVLCDLEGLTTDHAAAKLGLPVGTVRSRLARGRDRLRIRLVRRGFTPAVVGLTVASGKVSAVVPTALVHLTVRAAVTYASSGTFPVALGWLIRGGIDAMRIKGLAVLGMTAAVVASAGGMAAQVPGAGPGRVVAEPKISASARGVPKGEASPRDTDSDLERLQGRWVIVKAVGPKAENPEGELLMWTATISGDRMTFATDAGKEMGRVRFQLDPGSSPAGMLVKDLADETSPPQWMIYAFEKGRLHVALDDSKKSRRPKDFNDARLTVFEFVRPEDELARTALKPEMPIATKPEAISQAKVDVKSKIPADAKGALPPRDIASDLAEFQTRWHIGKISGTAGENIDPQFWNAKLTFSGHTMTFTTAAGKQISRLGFQLEPGASPGAMLVKDLDVPTSPPQWMIYAFEPPGLRLALSESVKSHRPKDFNDAPLTVFELARAVPDLPPNQRISTETDKERLFGRWRVTHNLIDGERVNDRTAGTVIPFQVGTLITFGRDKLDFTGPSNPAQAFRYVINTKQGTEGWRKGLHLERISPAGAPPKSGWVLFDCNQDNLRLTMYEPLSDRRRPALEAIHSRSQPAMIELHLVRDDAEHAEEHPTPKLRAGEPAVRETPEEYGDWRRRAETEIAILEARLSAKKAELQQRDAEHKVRQLVPMQVILDKLEKPITLSFKAAPLEAVLKAVRDATAEPGGVGLAIYVDPIGIQEANKSLASPVTIDLEAVAAKTCLRLILKQLGLAYEVRDGILTITSQESIDRPANQ